MKDAKYNIFLYAGVLLYTGLIFAFSLTCHYGDRCNFVVSVIQKASFTIFLVIANIRRQYMPPILVGLFVLAFSFFVTSYHDVVERPFLMEFDGVVISKYRSRQHNHTALDVRDASGKVTTIIEKGGDFHAIHIGDHVKKPSKTFIISVNGRRSAFVKFPNWVDRIKGVEDR